VEPRLCDQPGDLLHAGDPGIFADLGYGAETVIASGIDAKAVKTSLPGLTRQSIFFEMLLRRLMDARVKPGHDECMFDISIPAAVSRSRGAKRPEFRASAGVGRTAQRARLPDIFEVDAKRLGQHSHILGSSKPRRETRRFTNPNVTKFNAFEAS
jgi:hypothetical protein